MIDANYVYVWPHKYFNNTFDVDLCENYPRARNLVCITPVLDEFK